MSAVALDRAFDQAEGWGLYEDEELSSETHLMPEFGPAHRCTVFCWCRPDYEPAEGLVVHNVAH